MAKGSVTIKMISVSICILPQQVSETKMTTTLVQLPIGELILLTLSLVVISTIMVILIVLVLNHLWFKRRLRQIKARIQTDLDQGQDDYGGSANLLPDPHFDVIDWERPVGTEVFNSKWLTEGIPFGKLDMAHIRTGDIEFDKIQTVPQVLDKADIEFRYQKSKGDGNWVDVERDSVPNDLAEYMERATMAQSGYNTAGFGTTGCVPGGVSFVGRTQTQIGSVTRQLNKRKSLFERVKHAVSR